MSEIEPQKPINPYAGPQSASSPVTYQPAHNPDGGDSTGGLIPYKNPKALIAYYFGILSGLPVIGLPLGIAAFVLGIMGLKDRKKNPAIKGSVHAGIGIGCGLIFTLLWGGLILIGIVAAISASSVRR
jgi:hypothetical protein